VSVAEAGLSAPQPAGAPPEALAALSLALVRANGTPATVRWSGCERRLTELRDAVTGDTYLAGCGAVSCPVCGPKRAHDYAEAIAWASPTTFGRLSLMPDSFEKTRNEMKRLRQRLTERFGVVEWAWVRHRNPKLTGYHVHFLGRMPWIPQRELQAMMGGRIPWISATKQELGSADYLMGVRKRSGASGYLLKRSAKPEFFAEHLALNGGRKLVHWSRDYFEDPEDPGTVLSVDEVLHRVRRARANAGLWYRPGGVPPLDPRKGYASPGGTAAPGPPKVLDNPGLSGQTALPIEERRSHVGSTR